MIVRRGFLLALLTPTALALETSLFGGATLQGTKPELLLLITVALAMGEGPTFGATAGFVTGLATDLVLGLPHGVTALTFTIVGYTVGTIRPHLQSPSAWMPIAVVSSATAVTVLFYGGLSFMLGQETLTLARVARHAGLAAAYNALLTPFVLPAVRALGARLRPQGMPR